MTRLILAPMEGLADDVLREVLTRVEAYDHAVTEFVRVSGTVLPLRAFTRLSPELRSGSATSSGTCTAAGRAGRAGRTTGTIAWSPCSVTRT